MQYVWTPNVGLGPVKLGDNIATYKKELGVLLDPDMGPKNGTSWFRYCIPGTETYVDVENDVVVCVSTYDSCVYRGQEIVGMTRDELVMLLGCDPDEVGESVLFDDGEVSTPLEYFDLGAQIWISNGRVILASISNDSEG